MGRSAIHPGEHLAEQLEELNMSAAQLARQLKTGHRKKRLRGSVMAGFFLTAI